VLLVPVILVSELLVPESLVPVLWFLSVVDEGVSSQLVSPLLGFVGVPASSPETG